MVGGWELKERCALRYYRVAGDAYAVVLEGEEEGGTRDDKEASTMTGATTMTEPGKPNA